MTIKEITLLSKERYEKYKSAIPKIDYWWWLRSPGCIRNFATVVNRNGSVVYDYVNCNVNCVRPALRLELEISDNRFWYKSEKLIGTKIEHGGYSWTILDASFGELYVLCDDVIAKRSFDPESNDWDKSELKSWLETEGLKLITT